MMESERMVKRQRLASPTCSVAFNTPSPSDSSTEEAFDLPDLRDGKSSGFLERAADILVKEAAAVAHVASLYRTDAQAREGLEDAVNAILQAQSRGGKLIICAVGKSAYIAMKTVATCKSLGIAASFLHACEAVHGDLGDVRPIDVLLFLSFSGRTPELLNTVAHIPAKTQVMAMTSAASPSECPLLANRLDGILLPAPIPEREEDVFGVAAPTLSTTVAIAVADMLALTVADQMHASGTKAVFQRHHPGGAIGIKHAENEKALKEQVEITVLELPSPSISGSDTG